MNQEATRQVIARDEKWIPTEDRVKISTTNVRLETTMPQKEETFQVIIDVIKNSTYYKAFTISAKVPKIFMQQFWYTVKKVKDIESYEFLLVNKKCVGMFYMENVDFPELIWEDFAFQIDNGQLKKGRHENTPYPRFTQIIINHFLSKHQSLNKLQYLHTHTIKDDRIVSRLKFVRIGEDFQEYRLPIPETMLIEEIKQSKSYKMFIKYSTGQIPPKKSRGKGSQGKKTTDTTKETVDVSKESDSEPVRKRTASRGVVKKKVTITTDDNIIPEPDIALELGKSISLTEAAEEEAARQVHVTHARIVTEPIPELARRRPSEQIAADTMRALKESKKTNRRQLGTGGSSEGTGVSPGIPDESTVVPATSSEGIGSEQESEYTEEEDDDEMIEWVDTNKEEDKKDDDDDKSINLEQTDDEETVDEFVHGEEDVQDDDEETDDEFVQGDEQVNDDEDEEMTNAKVEESRNGDEEISDAAKAHAEKTEELKDDAKKAEIPPSSLSLLVSLGFGDQFLKLSFDTSLIGTVKDTTDAEINSLLDIKIQSEVPHIQSPLVLNVPVLVIFEPSVLTPIPKTPLVPPVTTLLHPPSVSTIPPVLLQTTTQILTPPITTEASTITITFPESDALTDVQLRVAKLEKDVSELKKIDHSVESLVSLKSQVPTILKIKKEQAEKEKMPKYTIKSTDKAALKECDQKSALFQTMNENKTFNRNPANHALYHACMEALIEDENVIDKGVADKVKNHKRQHDDNEDEDEDPSAGPNQGKKTKRRRAKESEFSMKPSTTKETSKGKAPTKSSKTDKTATVQEPIEEPIAEVVMDDLETTSNEDVVDDTNRPQDYVAPKTNKPSRDTWFKQPLRPPTPDLEWNKRQVVTNQPEQPWFNHMVSAAKYLLTFDKLMATLIDFSNELEYNMEECFKALTDRLDWNNPKGDRRPFDLTKPLPLKGHPGRLTLAAEYFFNNDLEFLKSSDPEKKYIMSITKIKVARYEIVEIKDMVLTIWSTTKVRYDKDAKKKILSVVNVSVKKLHGYGHLDEIVVKRADCQLYKLKEGDFVDLHLNDIEDMLLRVVQHKLFNLNGSDIVDLIVALRMSTRILIIKRRVEDLQLGVESYQKKLSITEPQKTFPEI
ncbi:hypothetical protein Tco_0910370 [Tanacetum coccineum]|uniref:Uncharacterized protein n=1 Tax=Tanacetum coccineum TaxID=301880 RepID=A0ABQ5CST2_9ASTR